MLALELREKYINFFIKHKHVVIPSSSLVPENDPTVLFTTAGMPPLVPYLLGEIHPDGKRLTNVQKCIRTGDIDEVGDPFHHTFFEMLGNWSLGDPASPDGIGATGSFKKEAIELSFKFLTKELDISLDKLAVTVFGGDERFGLPKDEESYGAWKTLGISKDRIRYMPNGVLEREDNWWGPAGESGPCGPCTEMFFWVGKGKVPVKFEVKEKNGVEIGNDVLMEFNKTTDGKFIPLKQKNIDFGGGLERMLACLNGLDDNYQIDVFTPIVRKIEEISGQKYKSRGEVTRAIRIIADHLRAATFILGDEKGISPSNVDQGYVLRRLIRRAIRYGKQLEIKEIFTFKIAETVIEIYKNVYSELYENKEFIVNQLVKEEEKFSITLEKGEKKLNKMFDKVELFDKSGEKDKISTRDFGDYRGLGKEFFILFSEDGYPFELSLEILDDKRHGAGLNKLSGTEKSKIKKEFQDEFKKHQELSRTASIGKFKGGLADASAETTKGHTATHLLLAALRKILGDHVYQRGSNITPERIRLDFSHKEKLTSEQISLAENLVNDVIRKNIQVVMEEMTPQEAKKSGAVGVFEHKYQNKVKVYTIGDFSKEICGGPHVKNTNELGKFKILKEESSSSGVRRIKAILS